MNKVLNKMDLSSYAGCTGVMNKGPVVEVQATAATAAGAVGVSRAAVDGSGESKTDTPSSSSVEAAVSNDVPEAALAVSQVVHAAVGFDVCDEAGTAADAEQRSTIPGRPQLQRPSVGGDDHDVDDCVCAREATVGLANACKGANA